MDRRVQIVIDSMRADLGEELALDEIARSVNLSHSRLRYLFKVETGMSPSQYLKQLRMHEAKRLAESTFLNVKQIMNKLGMRDESHFVRDFKKAHGLTFRQYRSKCDPGNLKPGQRPMRGQTERPVEMQADRTTS